MLASRQTQDALLPHGVLAFGAPHVRPVKLARAHGTPPWLPMRAGLMSAGSVGAHACKPQMRECIFVSCTCKGLSSPSGEGCCCKDEKPWWC